MAGVGMLGGAMECDQVRKWSMNCVIVATSSYIFVQLGLTTRFDSPRFMEKMNNLGRLLVAEVKRGGAFDLDRNSKCAHVTNVQ